MATQGTVRVHAGVRNRSARAGSTVVQIYVRPLDAPVVRPERELKAFAKLKLDSSDSRTISLELGPRDFAYFDVSEQCWRVAEGRYEILAGFSAEDIRGSAEVTLAPQILPV